MRSLQGPDEPRHHPVGLSQSSVQLGLLPTIRNKAVNLVALKLIQPSYSVLPMKTKPLWHCLPCYAHLLNMSLSTFSQPCSHIAAYGSCMLSDCAVAVKQGAIELLSCHLLARICQSTWERHFCFSAASLVCTLCYTGTSEIGRCHGTTPPCGTARVLLGFALSQVVQLLVTEPGE